MIHRPSWWQRHPIEAALAALCAVALVAGYASHGGSATAAQPTGRHAVVAAGTALPAIPLPAVVRLPRPPVHHHHVASPAPKAAAPVVTQPVLPAPAAAPAPTPAPVLAAPAPNPAPTGPEVQVIPAG